MTAKKLTDAEKLRRLRKLVQLWRQMLDPQYTYPRDWYMCMRSRILDLEENGIIPKPRKRRAGR